MLITEKHELLGHEDELFVTGDTQVPDEAVVA